MMASIFLERAKQFYHLNLCCKAKQAQILQNCREQSIRKRMQSVPSIGRSVLIVEWLRGKSHPAMRGDRLRPSLQNNSKCVDPEARIQQKPTWPELKSAQPGSDQSMHQPCERYQSQQCQHRMQLAGKPQQRFLTLYIIVVLMRSKLDHMRSFNRTPYTIYIFVNFLGKQRGEFNNYFLRERLLAK